MKIEQLMIVDEKVENPVSYCVIENSFQFFAGHKAFDCMIIDWYVFLGYLSWTQKLSFYQVNSWVIGLVSELTTTFTVQLEK